MPLGAIGLLPSAIFTNITEFDHSEISQVDRQAIRDWCQTLGLGSFTGSGD